MKITIFTIGSRGDTQPYITLAEGLLQKGFEVTLVIPENVAEMVSEAKIPYKSLPIDVKAKIQQKNYNKEYKVNLIKKIRFSKERVMKELPPLIDISLRLCEGADLILYGGIVFGFYFQIEEILKIPSLPIFLQPVTITKEVAPIFLPVPSLGGILNTLAHRWMISVLWHTYRDGINVWRRQNNLHELKNGFPFKKLFSKEQSILYGYSPIVFPPPNDWYSLQCPAGYWFARERDYQPPQSLLDFLNAGPKPVYIGFGSMSGILGDTTAAIVEEAVKLSGCRAVYLTGWGKKVKTDLSPNIYCMEEAPHDWLFPRMAALVHHGGAGTTAAGLKAGKPAQIISHISDQMFWSFRLNALKAGLTFIDRKKLTAKKLANSINTLLNNKELAQGASSISQKLQHEDGLTNALDFIQSFIDHNIDSNNNSNINNQESAVDILTRNTVSCH